MDSPRSLARKLWQARRDGCTIQATDFDLPKKQIEAYRIQTIVIELSGAQKVGYKVGSTSREAQLALGVSEPSCGPLLAPYTSKSPAEIEIVAEQSPAVEAEFAFLLGCDLPPRRTDYTRDDIAGAIAKMAGAIEVVGTRFHGGLSGKGRLLTTADCSANIALVHGDWVDYRGDDLRQHGVKMTINNDVKGIGQGRNALDDPLNVVVWLANHLSGRRLGLNAGDIISTGTCTGLDAIEPGDTAVADFGKLGCVEVVFR